MTGYYSTHFPRRSPPYVREAPAHFVRNGKHYLLTSGTTGYLPNPTEAAVADTWHGPYTVLGDVHPGDSSRTSFHSQISCIFKVEGKKDLYIAMADRWIPENMDYRYEEYAVLFERAFAQHDPDAERSLRDHFGEGRPRNTSIADYVWLPIRFENDHPRIDWLNSWSLDDYE